MSIARSIARSITRPIARGIAAGIGALRWFSSFGGNNYWDLDLPWVPQSSTFTIKLKYKVVAADLLEQKNLLTDTTDTGPLNERLVLRGPGSNNNPRFSYVDTIGGQQNVTVSFPVQAGTLLDIQIDFSPGSGATMTVNGVSANNPAVCDETLISVERVGANLVAGANAEGIEYNLELIDGTTDRSFPVNEQLGSGTNVADNLYAGPFDTIPRSEWLTGNAVDIYAVGSIITPSGGTPSVTVSFDLMPDLTPVNQVLVGDDFAAATDTIYINVDSGGALKAWSNGATSTTAAGMVVDGVAAEVSVTYTVGQPLLIFVNGVDQTAVSANCTGLGDITPHIFTFSGLASYSSSKIGNLLVTDDNSGDTYEWLCNNTQDIGGGQGLIPNTGNTGATYDMTVNNWTPADQTLVVAPTDGTWNAEPTREQG